MKRLGGTRQFFLALMVLVPLLVWVPLLGAQDGWPRFSKITLPAEVKGTASRLKAADRLTGQTPKPAHVLLLLGNMAPGSGPGALGSAAVLGGVQPALDKWLEALDEYQRLIYEVGDVLVPLAGGSVETTARSVPLRWLCHQRIAALPPAILARYQQRVDGQARKWLQESKQARDPTFLRRLINDYFCSSVGDQALELLGDLAFEKGHFAEALMWWRMAVPPLSSPSSVERGLRFLKSFPNPQVDWARVRGKQILAHLFQGDNEEARSALKAFREVHAQAQGHLAGRNGVFLDLLREVVGQLGQRPFWEDEEPWATFGGNAARNRVMSVCPSPRLWSDGPKWRIPLSPSTKRGELGTGRPAFFPLIAGDRVWLTNSHTIRGFRLATGVEDFRYDLDEVAPFPSPAKNEPANDTRFTLTIQGGRLLARLGRGHLEPASKVIPLDEPFSYLVCLDISRDGDKGKGRELWKIRAGEGVVFEGSPLVHEDRVFIASSRVVGRQTKTAIACYHTANGTLRWQHELCETSEYETAGAPSARHHLLTLAGGLLVYGSHSGVVMAVDMVTGRPAWATRYPSRGFQTTEGEPSPRDLCPCIYSAGRIFLAPRDSDRLLCLDAATGGLLWQRRGIDVVHLLGVAQGQVVFTTPFGLRALRVSSGDDLGGWLQAAEGKLPGLGRGLILGGWVFWPTNNPQLPLRAINVEDGSQERFEPGVVPTIFEPTQLRRIQPGNMAYAHGCLVVAGLEELVAYVAPAHFLDELRNQARPLQSTSQDVLYRLAQAEADAGAYTAALEHFELAAEKAPADPRQRRTTLEAYHALLMDLATHRDKTIGQPLAIIDVDLFDWAAKGIFPPHLRALALQHKVRFYQRPEAALAGWQQILADESLRAAPLYLGKGKWQRGGTVASATIAALLTQQPPALRAQYEKQGEELFRTAQKVNQQAILERVIQEYPHTPAAAKAKAKLAPPIRKGVEVRLPRQAQTGPFFRAWQTPCQQALPVEGTPFLPGQPNFFIGGDGTSYRCLDATTGQSLWGCPRKTSATWAGWQGQVLILAGADGIQAIRWEDGRLLWRLETKDTWLGPLSAFRLTREHLFCLGDERVLLALDVHTGAIRWHFWAPAGMIRPVGSGRWQPHFFANENHVLLQTVDGRHMILDSRTGFLQSQLAGRPPSPHSPLPLGENKVCLADDQRVWALNLATGKPEWVYRPPWPTSLTGEALQVFGTRQTILVEVPRNYGCEWMRLDPANGKPLWQDGILLSRERVTSPQVILNHDSVILATANQLQNRSLADGQLLWTAHLPEHAAPASASYAGATGSSTNLSGRGKSFWQLLATPTEVIAFPQENIALGGWWMPLPYFPFIFPDRHPSRFRGDDTWMIQLHDRKDGRLLQRLNFPEAGFGGGQVIHLGANGLVVAAGGQAWGFHGRK